MFNLKPQHQPSPQMAQFIFIFGAERRRFARFLHVSYVQFTKRRRHFEGRVGFIHICTGQNGQLNVYIFDYNIIFISINYYLY